MKQQRSVFEKALFTAAILALMMCIYGIAEHDRQLWRTVDEMDGGKLYKLSHKIAVQEVNR